MKIKPILCRCAVLGCDPAFWCFLGLMHSFQLVLTTKPIGSLRSIPSPAVTSTGVSIPRFFLALS